MDAIIQANGKEFIEAYLDLTPQEDEEEPPEIWIDDHIESTFIHPDLDWWGSDASPLGMDDEPTAEHFKEMTEYLTNNNFPEIKENDVLYNYGYYKAKEYRDDWVNQLKD